MTDLLSATTLGQMELKNRVFMAPLTRNRADNDSDIPGDLAIEYYAQRASAGLILTEATQISPMGKGYVGTPGIYTREQANKWRQITDAVHAKGGKIFIQLWHVGRISHTDVLPDNQDPVAPSAIRAEAQTFVGGEMVPVSKPRALSLDEIQETVEDYRKAAELAQQAGFDGVEIHAANGYLINQFLCNGSNHRDDEYGGSIEHRCRFLQQVITAVLSVWSPTQVGIRLSPTGTFNDISDSDPLATYSAVIDMLNSAKLGYLHIVEKFPGAESSEEDSKILNELINRWQGFYIANGDYDYDRGQTAIQTGHADAITYGRAFIANPDLPERFAQGAELNEPDQDTFYGGGAEGYTDYPFMDGEKSA